MQDKPFFYAYGDEVSNNIKLMKNPKTCLLTCKMVSGEVEIMGNKITIEKFIEFIETYK